ncbi:MMPL family transporter [Arthrobacter rhombi]|uniref:MMPL family transporter n=1 Tax=Arthrobacter rhombi TaxID=71253 RepID=UPI003FD2D384
MSTFLHRLGAMAHRRPWIFLLVWLLAFGGAIGIAATSDVHISSSLTIDGTPSQDVRDNLARELPAAGGGQGSLVFTVPEAEELTDGGRASAIGEAAKDITELPFVVDKSAATADAPESPEAQKKAKQAQQDSPRPLLVDGSPVPGVMVSADGSVAMLQMQLTAPIDELPDGSADQIVTTAQDAVADTGLNVLPSDSLDSMHPPIGGHEAIGLGIALLVLLLTLGSLRAAGLPLLTALTGVGIGIGGAFALSSSITLTTATPALALMIGLAVGIDYALFIVNRQRHFIIVDGLSAPEATARALATAGSAVVFAGTTVVIALAGLTVIGIGFLTTMALVAAATVALAVLIALTLLPALLGFAGEGICSTRARARGVSGRHSDRKGPARRWARGVTGRPWLAVAGVVVILGVAAIPALSMDLGMPTGAQDAEQSTSRQSYDATTRGFGEGFNAPLMVVAHSADGTPLDQARIGAVAQGLQQTDSVASASLTGADPDHTLAVFTVIPEQGPTDERTAQLVTDLRDPAAAVSTQAGVSLGVTGLTAINLDITDRLSEALPQYIAIIVGLSLLLLLLIFRSIIIPLKATAGFLLSIAATFGISTAVFQWGWLIGIVGLDNGGPLLSFLPIMVTGILYGLAMDYQVFLVSSMREAHTSGLAPRAAIIHGFEQASRVVTAAAIIMVSVFAAFIFSDDTMIKQFGFTLAIGVVIDAFLVRMTFIPALMSLLGRSVWWLPGWLDRILPSIDLEGEDFAHTPAPHPREVEATATAG